MFVLGVDIGYSNLKLAIGQSGSEPKTIILPAGAGPADRMPERIGGGDDETCLYVSVDNERWAAGVPAGSPSPAAACRRLSRTPPPLLAGLLWRSPHLGRDSRYAGQPA